MKFSISPRRYAYFSAITFCVILALHFTFLYDDLFQGSKIAKFFSLRHELNLPTFVSSLNLYLASLLSLACGLTQKNRRASRFFGFVAFILLVMGYDEASGLHEHLGSSRLLPESLKFTKVDWLNLYLPIISSVGLLLLVELLKTVGRPLKLLLPAILFLTGSMLIELAYFSMNLHNTFPGSLLETLEESLEMISIMWLNHSLLTILRDSGTELKINFGDKSIDA